MYRYLRHGKRRSRRGNYKNSRDLITNRVPIEERPSFVESRRRLGDVEVDLIMGENHDSVLLVMTDRATLITTLDLLKGKGSKFIEDKISKRISRIGSIWIATMTSGNGKEFARHQEITKKHNIKTLSLDFIPHRIKEQ